MLGRLSPALIAPSDHEVILEPQSGDVQMMSSLFVKVDCRREEAAEDGRISLTVLRPFRSPLSQSTSKHLPCTAQPGSGTKASKVGCSWLLAAADPDPDLPDTGPEDVPYPRTPPAHSASSHPFVSYLSRTGLENLSLTS